MSKAESELSSISLADQVSRSSRRAPIEGRIGFVGLGHMGTAMAANLVAAGRTVIGYVRRSEQAGNLMTLGLKATTNLIDVFDCEIVVSMLPDDHAVREVVYGQADLGADGLAKGLMHGVIHLSMSTISTATAVEIARAHTQRRRRPDLSGRPDLSNRLLTRQRNGPEHIRAAPRQRVTLPTDLKRCDFAGRSRLSKSGVRRYRVCGDEG